MSSELVIAIYAIVIGFVGAGVIGSFYQLVTNEPPRFVADFDGILAIMAVALLCAATGPIIIMRNAIRGRRIEQRPLGWLAASSVIALGWSMCSGIIMLQLLVYLRHNFV